MISGRCPSRCSATSPTACGGSIDSGLQITAPYGQLIKWFIRLAEETRGAGRPPLRSLIDSSVSDWERELVRERARRTGKLGWTKSGPGIFRRCYRHLLIAYDPREWWQHDAWSPRFDARIPLREHEPAVARAGYDFMVIEQRWLREALKWQLKTALETGLLRWASVLKRLDSLTIFSQFIAERGIDEPRLCADRAELRLLALDFLAHVKQRRARCGANRGELVANGTVRHTINHVERFYAFMADYKEEAARALGEPRWEALGDQHARLWRPGEKPLPPRLPDEDVYFDEHTMAQVMRHAGLLGAPPEEGGIGDEQAMRILMLLARTGRRAGELLLLDFDCLLPIAGIPAAEHDAGPDAVVAKLRFQQTKIEGAPNTIFVDSEVVAIIRAQQQWVHDHVRTLLRDPAAPPPRYLFLAIARNNLGRHSYPKTTRHPPPQAARRAGGHPRQPRPTAAALQRAPFPAHARDEPDQRRRPRARGPALPRAPLGRDDDAIRPHAPGDARAGVPALQEDHRRRRRPRPRPARPVRADRARQAHRPGAAKRAVHAPAPPDLQPRQRLPDLRQVHHRRQLPARTRAAAGKAQRADRAAPSRVPRPDRRGDGQLERVARAAPDRAARPGEDHHRAQAPGARRASRPGGARRWHQRPRRQPARRRSAAEMARGNPENLRAAAQRKHQAAIARATTALDALERDGTPVTFRGLAKTAGVSVDFLYRSTLRATDRAAAHRARQRPASATLHRSQQEPRRKATWCAH